MVEKANLGLMLPKSMSFWGQGKNGRIVFLALDKSPPPLFFPECLSLLSNPEL